MTPPNSCNGAALLRFGAAGFLFFMIGVATAHAQSGPGWTSGDVGSVGLAGSANESGGVVTVRGAGADIWGRSDGFHFRWQTLNGDGALVARVTGTGGGNAWAKIGLMVREDLTAGAKNVMAIVTPANRTGLQSRAAAGADTVFADAGATTVPVWLMLDRTGNTFRGYRSADGNNWTPIGTATVAMPAEVRIGLAVSSHNTAALQTATFDNLMRIGETPSSTTPPAAPSNLQAGNQTSSGVTLTWTDQAADETGFAVERAPGTGTAFAQIGTTGANIATYTDSGLAASTSYTYRVRALRNASVSAYSNTTVVTTLAGPSTPPPGWASIDLGSSGGSTTASSTTVALASSGGDIWSNRDVFRFHYRELHGDGTLTARVTGLTKTANWAKAGVMIRSSLDPYSANAAMVLSAGNVCLFQTRAATPGMTEATNGPWVNPVYWVRISRVGNVFTGSVSPNGTNWTVVGSRTLALPTSVHLGLVASSHNTAQTTATFDSISVTGAAAPGAVPPSAPDQPSMSVQSSSSILVGWRDNSTTETGFVVERSTNGTNFAPVTTTAPDATNFTDTGLTPNTTYHYRICARNGAGDSAYTVPLYVTTFP